MTATSVIFQSAQARSDVADAYVRFRDRLQAPSESRHLSTRFGDTHVLITGPKSAPPLVVLHGALASSAHVTGELAALVERFRVYAVDIVGQSVKSADVRLSLDGRDYADWLADVFDGLNLSQAHLFGVSWGGFVARRFVEHFPERVQKLVLLVPAGFVSGPAWAGFTKVAMPLALYKAFPSRPRLLRFLSAILTTLEDDAWVDYMGTAFRSYKLDIRLPPLATPESCASFKGPVLVFGAEQDLSFPGAALLARSKQVFPQAETELLKGMRHSPATDPASRERLAERIGAFLLAT